MPKKRLVLIHGFLENASMWKHIIPHLSKKNYVVNTPEIPGHGRNMAESIAPTPEAYCKNILDQLDLEKDDTLLIVGHSMGGYLASSLWQLIPGQVTGLCLFHSKASADDEAKILDRQRAMSTARENKNLYVRTMLSNTFHPSNRESCKVPLENMISEAQQLPLATIVSSLQVMIDRPDKVVAMKERGFPLYYFLGDGDTSIPLDQVQEEINLLPGALPHIVHGIGHMGHIECTREAIEFVQRIMRADQ